MFVKNQTGLSPYRLGCASTNSQIHDQIKKTYHQRLGESNSKFFNIERSRNHDVHKLGSKFNETMQGHQDKMIDIPVLPLRSIITGHSLPYQRALYQINNDMSFFADSKQKDTLIAETFDWSNDGMDQCNIATQSWARFSIFIFETPIKFQVKPVASQIANLFISGANSYGREKEGDILFMLDFFIHSSDKETKLKKEKNLAKLILHTLYTGEQVTKQALIENDILKEIKLDKSFEKTQLNLLKKTDKQQTEYIERLNKFIYLIGVIETHRRLYPFLDPSQNQVIPELPMGIAVAMALKLISVNALNFELVFGKDPKNFGPFTDDQINSLKGIKLFEEKMSALVELYYKHFPSENFTQETLHSLLKETYGGEDDTDGEEYLSGDEEPIIGFDEAYSKKVNSHFQTRLHIATLKHDLTKIKKLLASPIEINAQDYQEKTALHYAVEQNFVDIVRLFLAHHADVNICDDLGNYPLHYAVEKDFILVQELLKLHGAEIQQMNDLDSEIVFNVDKYGESILHNAVTTGDKTMFFKVLKHPSLDIELKNSLGQTALHLAASHQQIEFLKILLKKQANPNATDFSFQTPLHLAKKNHNKKMIKLLMAYGGKLEYSSDDEDLALTSSEQSHTSVSSFEI